MLNWLDQLSDLFDDLFNGLYQESLLGRKIPLVSLGPDYPSLCVFKKPQALGAVQTPLITKIPRNSDV